MPKPLLTSLPTYYHPFVDMIVEENVVKALQNGAEAFAQVFQNCPEALHDYAYEKGKWTVKEVAQHVIDTERIFTYRALCFARGEKRSLEGFDQLSYAQHVNCKKRSMQQIISEFSDVRSSTISLYESFNSEDLKVRGNANGLDIDVNALGFITVGHALHHAKVIRERYINKH